MKQILARTGLFLAVLAMPAAASAAQIDGQWRNPKGNVIVKLARCGAFYCGTVVEASAKAKDTARKGGTPNLVGTRILSGVRPIADGAYKGQAFDPKRNIRAPATIRLLGPSTLSIKGCLISGIICKEQRWTRIS